MNIPPKLEGTIYILVGIAGIYSRQKQMNFDPVTGKESFNPKATRLRRNLMIALGVCLIAYGFLKLIR